MERGRDAARRALDQARALLSQGRPMEDVLELLRGEEAPVASAVASLPAPPSRPDPASDLARLLAQVSLVAEPPPADSTHGGASFLAEAGDGAPAGDGTHGGASLLAEAGRGAVAGDALADGSSIVCARCGGVIAARRIGQHAEWCSGAQGGDAEEDNMDD